MSTNIAPESKEKTPDQTLKNETFDFFYRICGYTPIPEISLALSNNTFGFFLKKYKTID